MHMNALGREPCFIVIGAFAFPKPTHLLPMSGTVGTVDKPGDQGWGCLLLLLNLNRRFHHVQNLTKCILLQIILFNDIQWIYSANIVRKTKCGTGSKVNTSWVLDSENDAGRSQSDVSRKREAHLARNQKNIEKYVLLGFVTFAKASPLYGFFVQLRDWEVRLCRCTSHCDGLLVLFANHPRFHSHISTYKTVWLVRPIEHG